MATRSMIGIMDKDGMGASLIYCHWDGYPDGVGADLKEFYGTEEKARALLELGDISSLRETLENTVAYHRDRGEELNPTRYCANRKEIFTRADHCGAEYVYLFHADLAQWECLVVTRSGLREWAE